MKKLLRILASGVLGLSMTTGAVMAMADASIGTTGPDSENSVEVRNERDVDVDNDNDVDVTNDTEQDARTGNARVHRNTSGEDAETGSADNDNWTMAEVSLDNTSANACLCGDDGDYNGEIDTTGPDSENKIEFKNEVDIDVDNDNDVEINNDTEQTARSGDATVSRNTSGGGASTGDASNINTSEFVINISN